MGWGDPPGLKLYPCACACRGAVVPWAGLTRNTEPRPAPAVCTLDDSVLAEAEAEAEEAEGAEDPAGPQEQSVTTATASAWAQPPPPWLYRPQIPRGVVFLSDLSDMGKPWPASPMSVPLHELESNPTTGAEPWPDTPRKPPVPGEVQYPDWYPEDC